MSYIYFAEDNSLQKKLSDNPQKTHFRQNDEKYSKFLIKTGVLAPSSRGGFNSKYDFEISGTSGDYLLRTILQIKLPSLKDLSGFEKFAWVNKIGHYLIKSAKFIVGGVVISEIDGRYMDIESELCDSYTKKKKKDFLIGNELDLLIPADYANRDSSSNYYNFTYSDYRRDVDDNITPVVDGPDSRLIFIDLSFYFSRSPSLAFPISKLKNKDAVVEIELAKIEEVLRSFDTTASTDTPMTITSSMKTALNDKLTTSEVSLIADYGYVSNEERELINNTEEFPIIQTTYKSFLIDENTTTDKFSIKLSQTNLHEFMFAAQRENFITQDDQSHITLKNDWTNYTTSASTSVSPNHTNKLIENTARHNKGPSYLKDNEPIIEWSTVDFGNFKSSFVDSNITNYFNPPEEAVPCIGVNLYNFCMDRNSITNALYVGDKLYFDLELQIKSSTVKTKVYVYINTVGYLKITNSGGIMIIS